MRYLAPTAALVLLAAMLFSSCTCHDQVAPHDESASNLNIIVLPTATAPEQVKRSTPAASATVPKAAAESHPSPTPPDHLPTDFPSDVPVIPGSTLAQVLDVPKNGRNVLFTSEKPVPDLVRTYRETMTKAGWRVTQEFETDKQALATYQKGKTLVNVQVMTDADAPGQNVVAVMYYEQEPLDFPEDGDGDE